MKNANISKMVQKRLLAVALTLALLLSSVFVPAVACVAASAQISYFPSDVDFSAPTVSCAENSVSKELDATITFDAVKGADNYKVNLYEPNGKLISADTKTTTATVSGISAANSTDEIYTVQIVAYKGEAALCASVVKRFIPYDESNASLRDYNGSETNGWGDNDPVGGFKKKGVGTNSPDGTAISEEDNLTWQDYTFRNINIAEDAEYLTFWWGTEFSKEKNTTMWSNTSFQVFVNGSQVPKTNTNNYTVYYVNSDTGELHTHERNAENLWKCDKCSTTSDTKWYVAIPLSVYDVTDAETKEVSNPIKGKTCKVQITPSLTVYDIEKKEEISNRSDRPFSFDSIGYVKDINKFATQMANMHANYNFDDITVTPDHIPYEATNPGFTAPTFKNTLTDKGITTEFAWDMFPNAATYQLKVYNSMLNEVASKNTPNLTATVNGLVETFYYTVQVTALDKNGNVLGASAYRKFIAYDNSKYYKIGNDGSGAYEWATGGPITETPDGTGVRMTSSENWISYDFSNVTIPKDSQALVIWVGQNEVEDGSRLLGSYKLRFMVNGSFNNCDSSGDETTVYYISSENGSVVTHNRSVGAESNLNTWWFPNNHENKFAGVGYVIIPLDLFDSADVESVRGTTTGVRFEYTDATVYNADGSKGSGVKLNNTRYIYMDNVGTISNVDAFVNEFDEFNATYNSEVGYYNTTDTTAVFTATGTDCGTLSLVSKGMKYSVDGGENWIDVTGSTVNVTGVTAENGIQVYLPAGDIVNTDTKKQVINITKPAAPTGVSAVQSTTNLKADGKITGVTADMEYSASGTDWKAINGDEVTGLETGTYYVRYKANGTALASAEIAVIVEPAHTYNAVDLTELRKHLLNSEYEYAYADVNGDTVVDVRDLVRLKKILAGVYTD